MPAAGSQLAISMRAVTKRYGTFTALNAVNLEVPRSERVVICGPSGSGKSTLIRCINRLEVADGGDIVVGGIALDEDLRSTRAIRRRVGMVFQQFNLFPHMTALENLCFAPVSVLGLSAGQARDRAMRELERVRIADMAHKYPGQMSGGQQQRVAIARTLTMEPEILLFDEPTSALDPEMVKEVLDVMLDLASDGRTMLCVTHEMGFARAVADRIIFMDGGEIVEASAPDEFFNAPSSERTRLFLSQILNH
jgi:general L-amino acid transport system ATP-binding protein